MLQGQPQALRLTVVDLLDRTVTVFDLEIIRIDQGFDPHTWDALRDADAVFGRSPA